MSYSLGTCPHNNLTGYCPSCLKEKSMMRGMGRLNGMGAGMGDCQPGYSSVLGICLPSLSTDLSLIQNAVTGAVATGVATTPSIQQAAANAATQGTVTSIVNFVKAHPLMVGAGALLLGAVVFAGLKKI